MSDEYLNHPYRIVRTPEVYGRFGVAGRGRQYKGIPKMVRFANHHSGWKLSEIQDYFARLRGLAFDPLTPAPKGQRVSLPDLVVLFGLNLWETKVFVTRPDFPQGKVSPGGGKSWKLDEVLAFIDRVQEAS
jgi:predicted DNA-binding transcriptional regulator AlpA